MTERKQTPDVLGEILGQAPLERSLPVPAAPAAGSHPAAPEHPHWEYIEVLFRDYGGLRPRALNGEEIGDWKKQPVIYEYLNRLGEQGWELVGLGPQRREEVPGYFKRRKL